MYTVLVVLCCVVLSCLGQYDDPFIIPRPTVEAFRPKGVRVSIPDSPGIRLFAFHGVVNRELNGLEAGDMSQDILKKTAGRWVFEDKRVRLNLGDELYFWLFVIKDNLGYRLDNQHVTITSFSDAPPGWPGRGNDRPTQNKWAAQAPAYPEFIRPPSATEAPSPSCNCRNQQQVPQPVPTISIPPPMCIQPVSTTELPAVGTTTTFKPTAAPAELQIWRDILVNLSTENAEFRDKVQVLMALNALMISKLEKVGDENLKKLTLGGKISQADAPFPLVQTVLKEKLGIMNKILRSAVRNSDGTVTFELATFNDKLTVLLEAKQKLKDSKIIIKDIDAVSFLNPADDRMIFDMRSQQTQ